MISTSKRHAEHPFAGQYTQQMSSKKQRSLTKSLKATIRLFHAQLVPKIVTRILIGSISFVKYLKNVLDIVSEKLQFYFKGDKGSQCLFLENLKLNLKL